MSPCSGCHRLPDWRQAPSQGGKIPWELLGCSHEVRRKQPACDISLQSREIEALGPCPPSALPPFLPAPCLTGSSTQLSAVALSWL